MEKWIISIAPSIFIIIGGIVTWFIKSRSEELQAIEKMLREKQREIYLDILDPYIHLFANLASGKNQNEVMKKIVSYEYRKHLN